jgi:hypothetical protein
VITLSRRAKRKSSSSLVVSTIVHVVAIVGLAHVLSIPSGVVSLFEGRRGDVPVERIGFVSLPRSTTGGTIAGVVGGDGRPVRDREVRGLVAPRTVPVGVPVAPATPPTFEQESGSGPLVGTGGPRRGVRPEYHDPRLWQAPTQQVTAPRGVRETIDAMIAADVGRITDSIVAAGPQRKPGDWTVERNGRKYGIDPQFIRLGPVSIPTAVLALLPINAQANPNAIDRDRALSYMNRDINHHAQRAITEDEFRRNVRNLRERKERERIEQRSSENERERQENSPAAPSDQQTR